MRELVRIGETDDTFRVEGVIGYLLGLLDVRGPGAGSSYAAFCADVLSDPRSATSLLGLQATVCVAGLGHPDARGDAAAILAAADPALLGELPAWCAHVGRVHVVEVGSLRTPDESESVLHAVLDYDESSAGSRHLLSVAVEHAAQRVHLLDVRARAAADSIAPIAEKYVGSPTATWTWRGTEDLDGLVAAAVRTTWAHDVDEWPVQDVEGNPTPAWAFGVRRLEQLTGASLRG